MKIPSIGKMQPLYPEVPPVKGPTAFSLALLQQLAHVLESKIIGHNR